MDREQLGEYLYLCCPLHAGLHAIEAGFWKEFADNILKEATVTSRPKPGEQIDDDWMPPAG